MHFLVTHQQVLVPTLHHTIATTLRISAHLASPLRLLLAVCHRPCSSAILTTQRPLARWIHENGYRWIDGTLEVVRGEEGIIWRNAVRCTALTIGIFGVPNASGKKLVRDFKWAIMDSDIFKLARWLETINQGQARICHDFVASSLPIDLLHTKWRHYI